MELKLKEGLSIRSPKKTETKKAEMLFNKYYKNVTGESPTKAEVIAKYWESPNFKLENDARVIVNEKDEWLGYAVSSSEIPYIQNWINIRVDPEYPDSDINEILLDWAENRTLLNIPKAPDDAQILTIETVYDSQKEKIQMLKNNGFSEGRYFWRMGIDLDDTLIEPNFPEGITISTIAEKNNLKEVIECDRSAFKDHWGYVEMPFDEEVKDWEHWIKSDPFYDPKTWFIAYSGDNIVGLSLCMNGTANDKNTAYIDTVCVTKEFRKKGIAAALLRYSFIELKKAGRTKANLHVDAASLTGATKLYEGVGMKTNQFSTEMEKVIREGKSYRTENI